MFLSENPNLSVLELILEHGSNTYIERDKFSHVSNISVLNSQVANTSATVHYSQEHGNLSFDVVYNRIDLGDLFGLIPLILRSGKVDWRTADRNSGIVFNGKFEREVRTLYGINLTDSIDILNEDQIIIAKDNNPMYIGEVGFTYYSDKYNEVPFNTITGYTINKFKGSYTLMTMNPYPVGSFFVTEDLSYDPNGEIYGTWELDKPIIVSGDEYELMKLSPGHIFEMIGWVDKPKHIDLICLNRDGSVFNDGNAILLDKHWKITNSDSPLYNEVVSVIHREGLPVDIKAYMIIRKDLGYVSHTDRPKHRWKRVG